MRKWFGRIHWFWKFFIILVFIMTYANVGYWSHAWAVKAVDPNAFGHNFWYGHLPTDAQTMNNVEIASYELVWPLIYIIIAAIWLIVEAAMLFWKLAFQGEFFRLIYAHPGETVGFTLIATILILCFAKAVRDWRNSPVA